MIYLDNAATGGFKPAIVKEAYLSALSYLSANPGRSGHKLSVKAEQILYETRRNLSSTFHSDEPQRVIFTKNCTEALNIAILGTLKQGDHVVTTATEHNSVLRPLAYLFTSGKITYSVAKPENGKFITAEDILPLLKDNTSMVIVNGASNVTGAINDIDGIGNALKGKGIIYLVDGAQLAGHETIDMKKSHIDILAVAGHKSLCGIMGTGALIFNGNVNPSPIMFGGTGTETFSSQPECYPEKLESGTINLPGICALNEGVYFATERLEQNKRRLTALTQYVISKLDSLNGIKIYSEANACGIVSFETEGVSSMQISQILSQKYDIAVRGGFHCAPLIHKFLGTEESGLVRVSLSPFNTENEINKLFYALKEEGF